MTELLTETSLTIEEAAKLVGVSYHTVWRWMHQEADPLESYKVGRHARRTTKEALSRFVVASTQAADGPNSASLVRGRRQAAAARNAAHAKLDALGCK